MKKLQNVAKRKLYGQDKPTFQFGYTCIQVFSELFHCVFYIAEIRVNVLNADISRLASFKKPIYFGFITWKGNQCYQIYCCFLIKKRKKAFYESP